MVKVCFFEKTPAFDIEKINAKALVSAEKFKKSKAPEIKRLTSLLGEMILRSALINEYNSKNTDIIIERTENGKPYLKNISDIYFNISHSGNAVAVAISDNEIGIDIEKIKTPNLKVAERFFTENEKKYINSDIDFFEIWTKKEAYFKQLGKGISDDFSKTDILDKGIKTITQNDFVISVSGENAENLSFNVINEAFNVINEAFFA